METAAFDTDPMLRLLTEALRRGPGSPEWHRAVSDLRDVASPQADEYKLLIAARERLESGRAYREVRAGPAFTRELFGRIDAGGVGRRLPVGLIVRLVCLLAFVVGLGVVVMLLAQGGPRDTQRLSSKLFITPVRSWTFASLPKDLHPVGPLPLEAHGSGLRAAGHDTTEPTGGLVYADDPLDLGRGTCLEMRLDYKPGPTGVQLVLLQDAVVSGTLASVGAELAIVCDANGVRFVSQGSASTPRPLASGSHLLRLKVLGDAAVAEVDGQAIWDGTHTLGTTGFAAVRFVRDGRGGDVAVQSLRVLAP